jgi:hypothetical protein
MIVDVLTTTFASLLTVIIAKTRCVSRFDCCSASFNDPHVPLDVDEKREVESDEESIKTLPVPSFPYHSKPLPVYPDLRKQT